jgi:hypothetical protein
MRTWWTLTATTLMTLGLGAQQARAQYEEGRIVEGWYQKYLHRCADGLGLDVWGGQLRAGVAPDKVLAGVLGSEEYYGLHGRCPEGFVAGLYADILGRGASREEIEGWVGRLAAGGCRETLAFSFLCESRKELAERAAVVPVSGYPVRRAYVPREDDYRAAPRPWEQYSRGRYLLR